jgi:hypothetical protein
MTEHVTNCRSCGAAVSGEVYHLGFSQMDALYCSTCPRVLLLKDRSLLERRGISFPSLDISSAGAQPYCRHVLPTFAQIEALFDPCQCGGHFKYMNPPRCPKCFGLLLGDIYEDKPILKFNDGYVFVTAGSIDEEAALSRDA